MKKIFLAILLTVAIAAPAFAATPLHVIFDTDMGNDVDDAWRWRCCMPSPPEAK